MEPTELATRQLRVSVWHLGTLARRVFLGEVVIPLATWDFEDRTTQSARWYPLQAKVMSALGLGSPYPHPTREPNPLFKGDPRRENPPGEPGTQDPVHTCQPVTLQ